MAARAARRCARSRHVVWRRPRDVPWHFRVGACVVLAARAAIIWQARRIPLPSDALRDAPAVPHLMLRASPLLRAARHDTLASCLVGWYTGGGSGTGFEPWQRFLYCREHRRGQSKTAGQGETRQTADSTRPRACCRGNTGRCKHSGSLVHRKPSPFRLDCSAVCIDGTEQLGHSPVWHHPQWVTKKLA